MQEQVPSRTAWRVAARRAAHQLLDVPKVFDDPLATRILGDEAVALIEQDVRGKERTSIARVLRAFMAVRSRFAEDEIARAVEGGVTQVVVLGAGLDTFGCRNPFTNRVRVFEVDHPATQAWKRHMLENAKLTPPSSLTFVPVDFERQLLPEALRSAGFDANRPAFFSWLGVTMYLARETVLSVLGFVGSLPEKSGVALDYSVDPALLGFFERLALKAFADRVTALGEPWTTSFDPAVLAADLRRLGFRAVEDLDPSAINARYFSNRTDGLKVGSLGHLLVARR